MNSGYTQAVIQVFYCYAPRDIKSLINLEKHLSPLKRVYAMAGWSSREILAGTNPDQIIKSYLNHADLILLLISPDFLYTDICYSIEMETALKRHAAGEAVVIPIILRPILWYVTPVRDLQVLPKNNKAISTWSNRDEAFNHVAEGVAEVVKRLIEKYEKRFIEGYITDKERETRLSSSSSRVTEDFLREKRAEAEAIYKNIYENLKSIQMEIIQERQILQSQHSVQIDQDEIEEGEGSPHTDSTTRIKIEGGEWKEQILETQHPEAATSINDLSEPYVERQGKYIEVESQLERTQAIQGQELGVQYLSTVKRSIPESDKPQALVSTLIQAQQWKQAERMARSISDIDKRAEAMGELISALIQAQQWEIAERIAFFIHEPYSQVKVYGKLASALIQAQQRRQAERALERAERAARSITQQFQQAEALEELASVLAQAQQWEQAEALYIEALHLREYCLGPVHPRVASPLNELARLYKEQGKYAEAEPLYQRALQIREQSLGPTHPDVASSLNGLAELYIKQGKHAEAGPFRQRALQIQEQG